MLNYYSAYCKTAKRCLPPENVGSAYLQTLLLSQGAWPRESKSRMFQVFIFCFCYWFAIGKLSPTRTNFRPDEKLPYATNSGLRPKSQLGIYIFLFESIRITPPKKERYQRHWQLHGIGHNYFSSPKRR